MTTITLEGKEYQLDIEQAKKLNLLKEKDNRVKELGRIWGKIKHEIICIVLMVLLSNMLLCVAEQLTHEAKLYAAFSKLLN